MQIFEPFIWGFDDLEAIFFMTLLLLLYFADIPYLGNEVPFYLCRMTRKIWLAGQVVYIVCATAIYTVVILLSTILICGQRCYVGNIWSETAVKLAFTSAGKKLSLAASETGTDATICLYDNNLFSVIRVCTCDGVIDFLVQDSVE